MKKISVAAAALAALLLSGCAQTADPCMAEESARYRGTYRVKRC